jgi:hypothetical protein
MRPVETGPGMGKGGQRRTMEGVNSRMIYFKNFCRWYNIPPPSTTIKKKNGQMNQWSRRQSSKIKPNKWSELISGEKEINTIGHSHTKII